MRQILPVLACALATPVLMATPSYAIDCSAGMIAPAPGETLSVTAIDANNACVAYLKQVAIAAEQNAKIADSERRIKGEKPADKMIGTPPPLPIAKPEPAPEPVLPQTDSLYVDQHGATAILVFHDGSTAEVNTGATLPDGLKVSAITRAGVFVRNADGRIIRLNDATSGFPAQAATSSAPVRQNQSGAYPFTAMPGMR